MIGLRKKRSNREDFRKMDPLSHLPTASRKNGRFSEDIFHHVTVAQWVNSCVFRKCFMFGGFLRETRFCSIYDTLFMRSKVKRSAQKNRPPALFDLAEHRRAAPK